MAIKKKKICQLLGIWEFSNTSGMGNSKHCEIGFPSNEIHSQILHSSVTDSWKRRLISALTCFSHLWNTWPCYPSTPFSSQLSRMIKSHNCGKQTTFALTLSLFPFLIHNLHRIAAENHLLAAVATDLLSTSQRNNWIGNWVASRFHNVSGTQLVITLHEGWEPQRRVWIFLTPKKPRRDTLWRFVGNLFLTQGSQHSLLWILIGCHISANSSLTLAEKN